MAGVAPTGDTSPRPCPDGGRPAIGTPPRDVPLVMRSRLGELGVCWMQISCGCGRSCTILLQLLAQRRIPARMAAEKEAGRFRLSARPGQRDRSGSGAGPDMVKAGRGGVWLGAV